MKLLNIAFTIFAVFSTCIFSAAYGATADYEYFGLQEPKKDERDEVYADLMYSGLREDCFYKFAKEYVDQNLTESGLINSIFLILNLYDKPWSMDIAYGGKIISPKLSEDDKKAFLIAELRNNIYPLRNGILEYNIEYSRNEYLTLKIKNINNELRNLFRFTQQGDAIFRGPLVIGNSLTFFLYKGNYDKELIGVLNKIYPDCGFIDYKIYDKLDSDFKSIIAKNYHELSYNQLIEMFNFVKSSWDTSLSVTSYFYSYDENVPSENVSIQLSKETGRAFIAALSRMRLTVNDLFPLKIKMPDGEEAQLMGGWFYSFVCTLPQIGNYVFSIKDSSEDIVWVKSLDVEGDTSDRLIPNGKYYSPELYNVVLSIFGELARKDFLESAPEKQEAKAE